MASPLDELLLEEEQRGRASPLDDLLAEEAAAVARPGQVEALGRGVAQGLSLGFADEIAAATRAGLQTADTRADMEREALKRRDGEGFTDYLKRLWQTDREFREQVIRPEYEREVAASRERDRSASQEHPWTYGGGQVAGALIPAILTGGQATVGGRIAAGVGQGAIQGVGASSADTLEGIATDAATGGALGGAFSAGGEILGAGGRALARTFRRRGAEIADDAVRAEAKAANTTLARTQANVNSGAEALALKNAEAAAREADEVLKRARSEWKADPKFIHLKEAHENLARVRRQHEALMELRRLSHEVQTATRQAWNARKGWDEEKLQHLLPDEARAYLAHLDKTALQAIRDHGLTPAIEKSRQVLKGAEKKVATSTRAAEQAEKAALEKIQRAERVAAQQRKNVDTMRIGAQEGKRAIDEARTNALLARGRAAQSAAALEAVPENIGSRLLRKWAAPHRSDDSVDLGAAALGGAVADVLNKKAAKGIILGIAAKMTGGWAFNSPRIVRALEIISQGTGAAAPVAMTMLRSGIVDDIVSDPNVSLNQPPPTREEIEAVERELERVAMEQRAREQALASLR